MGRKKNTSGGGAKTNFNGKKFEHETDLKTYLESLSLTLINDGKCKGDLKCQGYDVFQGDKCIGKLASQHALYSSIVEANGVKWNTQISKKLLPDEAYYSIDNNTLYIIEKKYQEGPGSVDEKLQTCDFKIKEYKKLVEPLKYNVKLIYILNEWFNKEEYKDVRNYIKDCDCEYYFNPITPDKININT